MRIVLIFILTLIFTTAVLYELNRRTEQNIIAEVEKQRHELALAISIAQQSLTSSQWLREFLKNQGLKTFQKKDAVHDEYESHIHRILVVGENGNIEDSSNAEDIDKNFDNLGLGSFNQAIDISRQHEKPDPTNKFHFYTFPLNTTTEVGSGKVNKIYLIIIFFDNLTEELREWSLNRLFITIGILLISILVALILTLEFTRPVGRLIEAAKQVATGKFDIHLPVKRRDELG